MSFLEYVQPTATKIVSKSSSISITPLALIQKGYRTYTGMRVFGQGGVLKCPSRRIDRIRHGAHSHRREAVHPCDSE